MSIVFKLLLGFSLSIDSFFSLLLYSSRNIRIYKLLLLPFLIGFFHFLFPIVAFLVGKRLNLYNFTIIPVIVFIFIGLSSLIQNKKNNENIKTNLLSLLVLSISVSLDSLFIGFSLSFIKNDILLISSIFGFIATFTSIMALFAGMMIKRSINANFNVYSGILFIVMGVVIYFI